MPIELTQEKSKYFEEQLAAIQQQIQTTLKPGVEQLAKMKAAGIPITPTTQVQPIDIGAIGGGTVLQPPLAPIPDQTKNAFGDIATKTGAILTAADDWAKKWEDLMKVQAEQTKTIFEQMKEMIAGRPKIDIATQIKTLQEQYGIPAAYEQIQAIIPEIATLNQQLIDVNTREQQSLLATEQKPIAMGLILGEQVAIQRQYAIEKSSISAQLGAKAAIAEMYRGNISLAQNLISDTVQALTYDYNQKIADWDLTFDLYKDYFATLDIKTQKALDLAYSELKEGKDRKQKEYDQKLQWMIDAAGKGIDLGWTTQQIKDMTLEEAGKKYAEGLAKVEDITSQLVGSAETGYVNVVTDRKTGKVIRTEPVTGMPTIPTIKMSDTEWRDAIKAGLYKISDIKDIEQKTRITKLLTSREIALEDDKERISDSIQKYDVSPDTLRAQILKQFNVGEISGDETDTLFAFIEQEKIKKQTAVKETRITPTPEMYGAATWDTVLKILRSPISYAEATKRVADALGRSIDAFVKGIVESIRGKK